MTNLIAALEQTLADLGHPPLTRNLPRDTSPAAFEDGDTLLRSRRSPLSTSTIYRRRMDQPREPWADELSVALGDRRAS